MDDNKLYTCDNPDCQAMAGHMHSIKVPLADAMSSPWAFRKEILQLTSANGGCTYDILRGVPVTGDWYCVGLEVPTKAIVPLATFNVGQLAAWLHLNGLHFANDPSLVVGTWCTNGLVHLDIVKLFRRQDDAMQCAKDNKQLAIFYLGTMTEIAVS